MEKNQDRTVTVTAKKIGINGEGKMCIRDRIEIIRLHWPELAQESQNLSAFLIRGLPDEMQSIVGVFLLQSVVFDAYGIACEIMPGHIFFFVRHKGPG